MLNHVYEWIEGDVTWELDTWLDPPIPLILLEDIMTEKEARIEATHVSIGHTSAIWHDMEILQGLTITLILLLINPVGWVPIFALDQSKFDTPTCNFAHASLEVKSEGNLVEESPGVVVFVIE